MVGVRVGLLVLLEEGVCAPVFVVVMDALVVPERVKEAVELEELVTVCAAVADWDADPDRDPDPVFVEEGVPVPVPVLEPDILDVVVPEPVPVLVLEPVFVALRVRLLVLVWVDVSVWLDVCEGVWDTVLNALREGLTVDVDE